MLLFIHFLIAVSETVQFQCSRNGYFLSLVDVCHSSYGIVQCYHVIFTVAECSVITVRYMTIRALAELISIVSPADPPMQPRSIPVCFGTSRTNASYGPVEPLPLNLLGGVVICTPSPKVSTFLAHIHTKKSALLVT
jgi:hypothetical protein